MTEPGWDLESEGGLRAACEEAEKQIDPERLAGVKKFLEEVAAVPAAERASEEFQRRVWLRNPIADTLRWVPDEALGNPELRQWFADRTNTGLPMDWKKRGEALADIFWEIVDRPGFILKSGRPRRRTLHALAALFPEHLTGAIAEDRLQVLQSRMGSSPLRARDSQDIERECREQMLYSYWIRHRLDEVLGEPETMEGHARHLLVSGKLAELVSGEWEREGELIESGAEHEQADDEPADPESENEHTTVWLFKAGVGEKDSEAWLAHHLAFIGWDDVGRLPDAATQEDIRHRVEEHYPRAKPTWKTNAAKYLRMFAFEARLNDLVVMPRKSNAMVAIGRIVGPYVYREVDGRRRHTRAVEWKGHEVPKDRLRDNGVDAKQVRGQTVRRIGGAAEADRIEQLLGLSRHEPDPSRLDPLPAIRRRKGIPSVPGGFAGMLALLEYVRDHPDVDDVLDYLQVEYPGKQERTHKIQFANVRTGFRCISVNGDRVALTELGRQLAQAGDPDVLRDDLLTSVLGPDHVIVALAGGARDRGDLVGVLRRANPGWGANFGPLFQLNWLESLDVVDVQEGGKLALTERGRRWRERVHWIPERLPGEKPTPITDHTAVSVPPLATIVKRVQAVAEERDLTFSRELIASLHLGLWANERRHFAILAGLSGSGKTQLAMEYGRTLTGADDESSVRLCAVSAAPGWHDPSPLLGYVNPLDGTYAGTDFQRFLLNAAGNPNEVHVCVLDEMNLSHPEQYLAPLLSAMEREGGMVEFHDSDEMAFGVPQRIPYPRNLVLIGTVNMDETTMGISDKVLDRAFTLEFWDIEVDAWPGWEGCKLAADERGRVQKLLNALMAALRPARLHFGWRVIAECVAFLERRTADSAEVAFERALDQITYAKVLPKLRGDDSQRYRTALEACQKVLEDEDLSESAQKVEELMQDLDETGSFRFWR